MRIFCDLYSHEVLITGLLIIVELTFFVVKGKEQRAFLSHLALDLSEVELCWASIGAFRTLSSNRAETVIDAMK